MIQATRRGSSLATILHSTSACPHEELHVPEDRLSQGVHPTIARPGHLAGLASAVHSSSLLGSVARLATRPRCIRLGILSRSICSFAALPPGSATYSVCNFQGIF